MPPPCADAPPRAAGAGERRPDAVAEGSPRPRHADPEGCRGVLPPLAQSLSVIRPKRRVADRSGIGPYSPSPTCASAGGGPVLDEAAGGALAANRDAAGAALNAYRGESPVDGPPPGRPYAVYLADADGDYWLLGCDLDSGRGPVRADLVELRARRARAGLPHLVGASGPGGGRHVWIGLAEAVPAPLVARLADALAARLPSLDTAPLRNPRTGSPAPARRTAPAHRRGEHPHRRPGRADRPPRRPHPAAAAAGPARGGPRRWCPGGHPPPPRRRAGATARPPRPAARRCAGGADPAAARRRRRLRGAVAGAARRGTRRLAPGAAVRVAARRAGAGARPHRTPRRPARRPLSGRAARPAAAAVAAGPGPRRGRRGRRRSHLRAPLRSDRRRGRRGRRPGRRLPRPVGPPRRPVRCPGAGRTRAADPAGGAARGGGRHSPAG